MFSEEELVMIALVLDEEEEVPARKKRKWIHEEWQKRETEEKFATMYKELVEDERKFWEFFKMSESSFNLLLSKLDVHLRKEDTRWRNAISPRERLAVTLRYLTTGDALNKISSSFCMGHSTVHQIVRNTCEIITMNLMEELMPTPTEEMWKRIAADFEVMWNFPNCIGVLDGKNVNIQAPPNSGAFNYEKSFSVILLALVDARGNFIAVDVGAYGNSSGGVFSNSKLGKAIQEGRMNIPASCTLPNTSIEVPYVIVSNESFPLKTYLMRPYPGDNLDERKRYYNCRLSRARKTSENTFAILSQNYRIYNRRIQALPKYADYIILTTCLLHNFVKKYDANKYYNVILERESRRSGSTLDNLHFQGGNATRGALHIRELFSDYFSTDVEALY